MEDFSDLTTEYFAGVSFSEDVFSQSSTTPSPAEGGGADTVSPPVNSSNVAGAYLRTAPWVVPLLAVAATNAAAIVAFEVYVLVRALHGTPSRRHLFLGQCLLLGLLMCSLSGLPIALTPTPLTCGAIRLLVGVSSALVFAALLVKCVFLISLNSGVYLPAHYQGLLLFFIVLVQVTVNIQWQCSYPPAVTVVRDEVSGQLHLSCVASYRQFLLSLIYVIILIIAVASLAIKCRGIRENYREASYIGAALGLVLPLWLSWTLAGLILPSSVQPACLGFGMVATATIVFVVMFLPKGRQLAAVGKEGLYKEDRDDRMSTLSGGARYSPSFFLFKPIKPPKEILRPANSIYKTHFSAKSWPEVPRRSSWLYSAATVTPPTQAPPLHLHCHPRIPPNRHIPLGNFRTNLISTHPRTIPGTSTRFSGSRPCPVHSSTITCLSDMFGYGALPPPTQIPPPAPHYWPPLHYYHHYYPGVSRGDEGVYTSIERPAPEFAVSSNPNFYLFRSHSHAGMMY